LATLCLAAASAESAGIPTFPEEGAGWDIAYSVVAREDFSTRANAIKLGSEIGEGGAFEIGTPIAGAASIRGASTGERSYRNFFHTRPDSLPLKGGESYRLTFSYRIVEAGDKGFEAIFFSPTAGNLGKWLPSAHIDGPAGKIGTAELETRLLDYPDYRAWLNVVGKGAIVVDDVRVSQGGRTVFLEDFESTGAGPGPGSRIANGAVDSDGWLRLEDGTVLRTEPGAVALPPMSTFRISFDYRFLVPPADAIAVQLELLPSPGAPEPVWLRPLPGNAARSGRFSTGFKTGSAGPYSLALRGVNKTRIAIDNVAIERGIPRAFTEEPAAYAYLEDASFPRLGNYYIYSPAEHVLWGGFNGRPWSATIEELERRLALFDVVFGIPPTTDPDLPARIKRVNPNAVLLPYVIAQETDFGMHALASRSPDPDGEAVYRYDLGLADEWYVKNARGKRVDDLDWPGILKLDISGGSARIGGKNFLEYQIDSYRDFHFASGIWDGLFIDNLFARMNPHIPDSWLPDRIDYDINRNGRRDETPAMLNRLSYDGERELLEGFIEGVGNRELMMGNNGPLPETRLAPFVNGYVFEGPAIAWEGVGKEFASPSEPGWRRFLDDYRIMEKLCRRPRINVIEGLRRLEDYSIPSRGRSDAIKEDYQRNRFLLGSALLGDAFYEYDLVDNRSPIAWFDEYAVGPDGIARESGAGKGYLGKALSPAVELASPSRAVWKEDFESSGTTASGQGSRLSRKDGEAISGKRSLVVEGKERRSDSYSAYVSPASSLRLEKGRTYVVEFRLRVLEDLDYQPSLTISSAGDKATASLNALFAGEELGERLPFTPTESGDYALGVVMHSVGKLALDDIVVTEGGAGPWRRDFENGFVLVNPYRVSARFDAASVAGNLGRTGVRRIKGSQAPEVNSGALVQGGLELAPFDAIILLADRRKAD